MPVKTRKAICELIICASFLVALIFITSVSNGNMSIKDGVWRVGVSMAVMFAASWKRGWLR